MTEVTISPPQTLPATRRIDYFSEDATARVKSRYKAEARFRFMGAMAVSVAAFFVLFLLGDIVRKGLPAFTEHVITLTIPLDAALIDPQGTRDTATLRAADYNAITREAFRSLFPHVKDRRERRALDGLLSTGVPDDVREAVLANPSIIGKPYSARFLLSDDADLYFKGIGTKVLRKSGTAPLQVNELGGEEVTLTASSPVFSALLAEIKANSARLATASERELAKLQLSAGSGVSAALDAKRAELTTRIEALRKQAADAQVPERLDSSLPSRLIAFQGGIIKLTEIAPTQVQGKVIMPLIPGKAINDWQIITYETPETNRRLSDLEITWLEHLKAQGLVQSGFATRFFTNGDSREPELAGIRGALVGSALTLLVTLLLCLPIGVGAAVYLEEFAPKNRFTDILEVNINNLAAVPSIVFGLLGLAMFLNFFGLPRSAPLVGGLVLALLVLPTIIIASRAALKAVPPSIKEAALGVGASHQQAIFHHVLPLAMPGIMTGTIIGMAHALGETAPLLMIGMVAFIVEVPKGIVDAATVLPVQIYLWSDLPELAFQSKTAATIMVLLAFLIVMNGAAILLRRRFERRW
jgi:phosphate transport system permease protein